MAMPPQGQPQQAPQPPPQGQPQGDGGSPSAIAEMVYDGLKKLAAMAQQANLPNGIAEKLAAVAQAFEQVIDELSGGGEQEPEGPPPQRGPSAGGPGAVPV